MKKLILLGALGLLSVASIAQNDPDVGLNRYPIKAANSSSAVIRDLGDKLSEQVSIVDFGAFPNDNINDVTAIRAARNYARSKGITLYVPVGIYTMTDSVHHPGGNLMVVGEGQASVFQLTNASMRCGWFVKNLNYGGMANLMIEAVIPSGTSTNMSGIEFQGSNRFGMFTNLRVALRNNNPGTNHGLYFNQSVSTAQESLWMHFTSCFVEYWKYGFDGGQGGLGNLRIIGGNYTQNEENIRLKGAGGAQINTAVGGFIGKIGVHLMDSCSSIDLRVFSEMITGSSHIAAVKIEPGANVNDIFILNHGDTPAYIDGGRDNKIDVTGTAPSVGGFYTELQQYRRNPPTVFTGFGGLNLMNGAQYLVNENDTTAGNNRVNQRLVFASKISAGGVLGATGGISSFRRSGGSNTGGIDIDAIEYGPLKVSRFDVFGQFLNYGDLAVRDSTKGFILKSPNGTCYRVTVGNTGTLTSTAVTCPKLNK